MKLLSPLLGQEEVDGKPCLLFYCPGCKMMHPLNTGEQRPRWEWNQNAEAPTFYPSVLLTGTFKLPNKTYVCHSWVKNGFINFLTDCTHHLSGQTVAMVAIPEDEL